LLFEMTLGEPVWIIRFSVLRREYQPLVFVSVSPPQLLLVLPHAVLFEGCD
jgi:hypothetical protein